ncbi:SIMPL domain-containing protein [Azoarcus sp. L1K30]|uniref:SIMPL domain-containing protein n=1 Tax=Azoarcus sp. L1K30 TaxID=2820277 RepID=UPI001B829E40|nr:SIMPL domain-containing protein [Azoarcus sp. L1K30]MBR0565846.1 SIMPL domain-containing protein [Azoarcus sp. L1K30]
MHAFKPLLASLLAAMAMSAHAHDDNVAAPRTIELSVEASQPADNDLGIAELYAEQSGQNAAAVARQINLSIAAALDTARNYPDIKAQSAGTSTWPVYAKNGGRIEAWRMRSGIRLESRNSAALSELVGKLQEGLAVARIEMRPAAETRHKAADAAIVDALRQFEQRATLIASTLGKRYRIHRLNVAETGARPLEFAKARGAVMMADSAPAPVEAGDTNIDVTVSGSIELLD